jgi:hypothetical protein
LLAVGDTAPKGVGNFTNLGAYLVDAVVGKGVMTMITTDQSKANYPLGWYTFRPGSGKKPRLVTTYNTPIRGGFGEPGNGGPSGISSPAATWRFGLPTKATTSRILMYCRSPASPRHAAA